MSDWPDPFETDPEDALTSDPDGLASEDPPESRRRSALAGIRRVLRARREPDPLSSLAASELATLSVAGLTRRRTFIAVALLVMAWVVLTFVQQVGQAAAITTRADEMRTANAALEARVRAAQEELIRIQDPAYIEQQARAYRLGQDNEIPFALAADPPPLGPDAPGSASNRVGADASTTTPLESWLSLLFGPLR